MSRLPLALAQEQIDAYSLEPIGKRDERYKPAREQFAWEAEALGQKELEHVPEREHQEREAMRTLLAEWVAA